MPLPPYPYTTSPSESEFQLYSINRPPRTWAAGDPILASRLRGDVSNAIRLLSEPPIYAGIQQTATATTAGSTVSVPQDTEVIDPYQGHSEVLSPGRYYLTSNQGIPGWYLVTGRASLNFSTTGQQFQTAVGFEAAGTSTTTWYFGGSCNTTSGRNIQTVAKLMPLITPGNVNGTNGDRCVLGAFATTAQNLVSGATNYAQLTARWLGIGDSNPWGSLPPAPPLTSPVSPMTAAWMNANVRDTIRALTQPPILEAQDNAGGLTLASQTAMPLVGTTVAPVAETVDTYGIYTGGVATIPSGWGGQWWAYGQVGIGVSASTLALAAGLTVQSSNYNSGTKTTLWGACQLPATTGNAAVSNTFRRLRLNAGDTVSLAGFRDGGTTTTTAAMSRLILLWEGF